MARTIEAIYADLLAKKEADPNLAALSSTSKTAIWRLWLYVVAYASWVNETLFDQLVEEIRAILAMLMPHTKRWYRNKALLFQYGFDLYPDTDKFINEGFADEQIAASKIIKYAAVTEATYESRLIVKIATEDAAQELSPITEGQKASFTAYMEEIRDAGVKVTVINYLPDILRVVIHIYYDPLVLNSEGVSILSGKKPVEDSLKAFQKELPFDGALILNSLEDKLQKTEGVKKVRLVSISSSWIDATGTTYGAFENITVSKIPVSGYFKIENFNQIQYIADVV